MQKVVFHSAYVFSWLFCPALKLKGGRERRSFRFADGCSAIASSDGSLGRVMKGREGGSDGMGKEE